MDRFILKAPYKPTGDQPQAIEQLVKGFKEGNQCQTLLGVTGSGKTFTMALIAFLETFYQLLDRLWLVSGWLIWGFKNESIHSKILHV